MAGLKLHTHTHNPYANNMAAILTKYTLSHTHTQPEIYHPVSPYSMTHTDIHRHPTQLDSSKWAITTIIKGETGLFRYRSRLR